MLYVTYFDIQAYVHMHTYTCDMCVYVLLISNSSKEVTLYGL